jgi:hypothetical protein
MEIPVLLLCFQKRRDVAYVQIVLADRFVSGRFGLPGGSAAATARHRTGSPTHRP